MEQRNLFPKKGAKGVVCLSGGVDSMALIIVLEALFKKRQCQLTALYFNHGTRSECINDENLIKEFCRKTGIELIVIPFQLDLAMDNFELVARNLRKKWINENKKEGDLFYTGHHIDDSFEWFLLGLFKSNHPKRHLGIPLRNGVYRRPFQCVTKQQIRRFAKKELISFREDSSNKNTRFERNYIREVVVPSIKARFPKYLKNYVHRANDWANKKEKDQIHFIIRKDIWGGVSLIHTHFKNDFSKARDLIYQIIVQESSKERGTLRDQINKCIEAQKNGKKGPLLFSGEVNAYLCQGMIYFVGPTAKKVIEDLDKEWELLLQKNDLHPFCLPQKLAPKFLDIDEKKIPFLIFSSSPVKRLSSLKKTHPLFPKSSQVALEKNVWFQYSTKVFKELSHN